MQEVKTAKRQGRPLSFKCRAHVIYTAYKKYLRGDSIAIGELKPEYKDILERAIKAASSGKTAYQSSQATGIPSDVFYIMGLIRRSVREDIKTQYNRKTSAAEVLKIIQKTPLQECTTGHIADQLSCDTRRVRSCLYLLRKTGKIDRTMPNTKISYWYVVNRSQSKENI